MKIVFFGTPDIAAKILSELVKTGHEVVGVVSKPDKPKGRSQRLEPPEVKVEALKSLPNIPIFQPVKCSTAETAESLRALQADIFVVVAFGEIISQEILNIPPLGCINIHASLLPKYRGAAPMQRALWHGESETGISIIKMVRKMDAGEVLYREALPIGINMTLGELESELCSLASKCLHKTLQAIENKTVVAVAQDEALVTFADKIDPQECLIDWSKTATEIHNQIRALSPHPGAYCYIMVRGEKKRLKILRSELVSEAAGPGKTITTSKNGIEVACSKGVIRLITIQLEGKPIMASSDFLKGTPQFLLA